MSTTLVICNYCKTFMQQLFHKIFQMHVDIVKSSLLREEKILMRYALIDRSSSMMKSNCEQ